MGDYPTTHFLMLYYYDSASYGKIHIKVNPRAKRIIGRYTNGVITLTVPPGTPTQSIENALKEIGPKLLAHKPKQLYDGVTPIVLPHYRFNFTRQDRDPKSAIFSHTSTEATIALGAGIDPASTSGEKLISSVMTTIASARAAALMIPRARQLADELRLDPAPKSFAISHGKMRLGTCSSRGEIKFSYYNFFLTPELRDYIILHEFAHLTHFDHSPAFHSLLNQYLNGREAELTRQLKNYRWPVLR